jgi:hypothetical protein
MSEYSLKLNKTNIDQIPSNENHFVLFRLFNIHFFNRIMHSKFPIENFKSQLLRLENWKTLKWKKKKTDSCRISSAYLMWIFLSMYFLSRNRVGLGFQNWFETAFIQKNLSTNLTQKKAENYWSLKLLITRLNYIIYFWIKILKI